MAGERKSPADKDGAAKTSPVSNDENKNKTDNNINQMAAPRKKAQDNRRDKAVSEKPPYDILITLAKANTELFHDQNRVAYATIRINGHKETWPVRSKAFKSYLGFKYFELTKTAASKASYDTALKQLEANAQYEGKKYDVHVRIASHNGAVYVDLGNTDWEIVKIDENGWSILSDADIKFIRPNNMRVLPRPADGGDITELRPLLNVKSEQDFILIVAFIICSFMPSGPYPILILNGEQGSGKSVTCRHIRSLADPNSAPLRSPPNEIRDLTAAARNAHMLCFDNISSLSAGLSDALCRIATGGGLGGRELCTDYDEAVFEAARPIMLNGIPENIAERDDLADRSFVVTLPPIAADKRMTEKEMRHEFEAKAPRFLGAILDAAACALRRLSEIEALPLILPRMADAANWMTAAEHALGWPNGAFLTAFETNRQEMAELNVEADPVASFIRTKFDADGEFSSTAHELFEEMVQQCTREQRFSHAFPKSREALGKAIRRITPALRQVGIEVSPGRNAKARILHIRKL